ncbi:MAG: hypothetical protein H6565_04610 [Lewinellaceae bacterium]|nr:hypothetical protein [Lewinellaceae bacterium]
MNKIITSAAFLLCFCFANGLFAQESSLLDQEFKTATIKQLGVLLEAHYVFPDVAKKTAAHLQEQLEAGAFDKANDLQAFAIALTESVQSVNHDKHMRIRPMPAGTGRSDKPGVAIQEKLDRMAAQRMNAAGFREAKRLDGNIGYLDLRGFAPLSTGVPMADRYMGLLAGTDAIIIDLRKNGGGNPAMVQYLCSYFFDEHIHLNSLYWREGDHTEEFWTLDKVGGEKMPDVPLFILTSSFTFSGAEEFSYNMQTRKRATLVGETTGGGANPGGMIPINEKLGVFIPTGTAINPVTGKNWEGTGVEPEIKTTADDAFNKAVELASTAARAYRQKIREGYEVQLTGLFAMLAAYPDDAEEEKIFESMQQCTNNGCLMENNINDMGYEFLIMHQKPETAEVIFKCNARLFPESANVYDSYGEALLANGKAAEAVDNYRKAVELAEVNGGPNLEVFKANLAAAEKAASSKRP